MQSMKLQTYIAHLGVASRRAAEKMISEGEVWVNNHQAHIGQRIDPEKDVVKVKGHPLTDLNTPKKYFLLNKPVGVVSTTQDELQRKTVLSFLPQAQRIGMYPVGRLDMESEGAILLTNDGELAYILTHPKFEIQKTYHVLLSGVPTTPALKHLERGVKLADEYIKPVKISILGHENKNTWLEVVINEGKKHQVRKMIRRIGYEVLRLKRTNMGPLRLGDLGPGKIRSLTQEEYSDLLELKKLSDVPKTTKS